MNIRKHVAGITLFIFIVAASIFIVGIMTAPALTIPPVPIHDAPASRNTIDSPPFRYMTQLVSLDFINQQSYTTLKLKRHVDEPAPERLWVYTLFFVPERPQISWSSGPVEVLRPFKDNDEATITVTGECTLCGNSRAPRNGYYARVYVSTIRREWDAPSGAKIDKIGTDITTAIPVLVQVEQQQQPRWR
jgi:hypothetical protein